DVRVKLQAECIREAERLYWKIVALREQLGAARQSKSFPMPVIDLVGPVRTERHARMGRPNWVIAYLRHAFRRGRARGAEIHREHLGTEADAKIWPPLP